MKKVALLLVIMGVIWTFYNRSSEVSLGPSVMAPATPQQEKMDSPTRFSFGEYDITEVAQFDIKAKVLAKKNYSSGREADLSPTDLALGWGRMSDETILEDISISQSGRFYRWRVELFPIPRREIETHSANMHLIPANEYVEGLIDEIRKGDIVEISGSLVNVNSTRDNWYWRSSQSRQDTGSGACELIYVKSIRIATL
ncbi:hypothetical protein [Pseudoalteromonas sp. GB56]